MSGLEIIIPLALSAAGTAVQAAGTIAGGNAAAQAGRARAQELEFVAGQQEMQAQESRAAAQREAFDKRRQSGLLQSQLQARAAASGGGADDPTILDLGGDIGARGQYAALTDMYRGENRARGLDDQAMGSRMTAAASIAEGEGRRRAAQLSAFGTILGGASSMFGRFGSLGGGTRLSSTGGVGFPSARGHTGFY